MFKNTPEQARALWVTALNSNEYTQTQGTLNRTRADDDDPALPVGMCCLGVACDIFIKEEGHDLLKMEHQSEDGIIRYVGINGLGSSSLLPLIVKDWLGLTYADGEHYPKNELNEQVSLSELNDSSSYSFKQIADVISNPPEGLLKDTD